MKSLRSETVIELEMEHEIDFEIEHKNDFEVGDLRREWTGEGGGRPRPGPTAEAMTSVG